ncbi:MAG: hypothetical protein CVU41_09455 [Chloroflexi bacterium HGW-Chloroflexi-3]|nr:MAG: hypothetical protein CVU41_09455 [Chloroflexi bacterium HGW-Chloroflexi-3]
MIQKEQLMDLVEITWGKSDRKNPEKYHLLIYHLLDTAAVAWVLWKNSISVSIRKEISELLKLNEDESGILLSCWIALHDIGKASPVFQRKNKFLDNKWKEHGIHIKDNLTPEIYHPEIGCLFLQKEKITPDWVAIAISGHHGAWRFDPRNFVIRDQIGDEIWDQLRLLLCEIVFSVQGINYRAVLSKISDLETENALAIWFSGFICMADWVASNDEYYENCTNLIKDFRSYFQKSLGTASLILRKLGWIGWKARGNKVSFNEMFSHLNFSNPRPVQKAIIEKYEQWNTENDPFLLIIEAPTGIGKTEIALYIADQWLQGYQGSGIYIAMPTMATSNMIFDRCLGIFENRYQSSGAIINAVLAHGQARWNENINRIRLKEINNDLDGQTIAAMEWFQNNRKRSLLAPFGVGTIDQVFLSILKTKHFFVRLAGLKNKVIIFDEVHAYDIYMNVLFMRLLNWLRVLNSSVIILSATLQEKSREEIIRGYSNQPSQLINPNYDYPRATYVKHGHNPEILSLTDLIKPEKPKIVEIQWIKEMDLVQTLRVSLSSGGCAAIICNTVSKAQEIYELLHCEFEEVILFHAKFPNGWRIKKEDQIFKKFGKKSNLQKGTRPQKSIIVSTQILEQSLDLDFDVMFTELAPVDLVLQRIGRLYRHERERSLFFTNQTPKLFVFEIEHDENGTALVEKREMFYAKSVLLKSYLVLKQYQTLEVEKETRNLIEQVYGEKNIPNALQASMERIREFEVKEKRDLEEKQKKASSTLISPCDDEDLLYKEILALNDAEDILMHEAYQAKTRDFGFSLQCICVFKEDNYYYLADDSIVGKTKITLEELDSENPPMRKIMQSVINVTNPKIIKTILDDPDSIKRSSKLRYFRILIFEDSRYLNLSLTQELGLKIF